jgi:crossover junction endodeoxyribonuclease RuvC
MRIVLGLDPGLNGGVAVLNEQDTLETAIIPTMGDAAGRVLNGRALSWWIAERDVTEAIIENAHSMPHQGVTSTFRFGVAFGQLLGVLQVSGIPYRLVTPQAWKKHYGLLKQDKDAARRLAIERFPRAAAQFARKLDVHRADAALIARYQIESTML